MTTTYPRWGLSDDLLAAIGSVGVSWGALDHETGKLATYLFTGPYTGNTHILTGTVEFKGRLALIRSLAHDRIQNRTAFSDLDTLLVFIENDLRAERNRITHDVWLSGGKLHVQIKPKFAKKPFAAREMETWHETSVEFDDVATLARLITDVGTAVGKAAFNYVKDHPTGQDTWSDIFAQPIASLNQRYRQTP